jgi:peptidoglycan hydrolase-like protein with peptidoglycan-binding domain
MIPRRGRPPGRDDRVRGARLLAYFLLAALVAAITSCHGSTAEQRAREAAEQIKASMPDVDAAALAQKVDPETVRQAQRELTAINEYQGEINGKLDSVTVNAIEAFQREADLEDDGILDSHTRERLAEAAAAKGS